MQRFRNGLAMSWSLLKHPPLYILVPLVLAAFGVGWLLRSRVGADVLRDIATANERPAGETVYVSRGPSNLFHFSDCKYFSDKMIAEGAVIDVLKAGEFKPCPRCCVVTTDTTGMIRFWGSHPTSVNSKPRMLIAARSNATVHVPTDAFQKLPTQGANVKPKCLSLLICREVGRGPRGGTALIDLIAVARYPSFPAKSIPFYVHSELADGRGKYEIRCQIVGPDNDVIAQQRAALDFDDPTQDQSGTARFDGVTFKSEGLYRVELYANDEFIADRTLWVKGPIPSNPSPSGSKDSP